MLRDYLARCVYYGRHHGLRATLARLGLALHRAWSGDRMILYGCDLATDEAVRLEDSHHVRVERKRAEAELDPPDLNRIVQVTTPAFTRRQVAERFERGASVWLARVDEKLAGYGWTLRGNTMEPHFFPLEDNDVHLFDFYVFPEFRGRRVNPILVSHILAALRREACGRAYIEAAEWNIAQLRSLSKLPVRKLGAARKVCFLRRTIVIWSSQTASAQGMGFELESKRRLKGPR